MGVLLSVFESSSLRVARLRTVRDLTGDRPPLREEPCALRVFGLNGSTGLPPTEGDLPGCPWGGREREREREDEDDAFELPPPTPRIVRGARVGLCFLDEEEAPLPLRRLEPPPGAPGGRECEELPELPERDERCPGMDERVPGFCMPARRRRLRSSESIYVGAVVNLPGVKLKYSKAERRFGGNPIFRVSVVVVWSSSSRWQQVRPRFSRLPRP